MLVPFGWFIEVGPLRWFTQEADKANFFRNRKDAKVTKLVAVESIEDVSIPYCKVDEPECDHEPDVLKRCVKCGKDLSISGMLTSGS